MRVFCLTVVLTVCASTFFPPLEIQAADGDCGFTMRIYRHPTTLSYHPEVYNYRYYFDIIGHETHQNARNKKNCGNNKTHHFHCLTSMSICRE